MSGNHGVVPGQALGKREGGVDGGEGARRVNSANLCPLALHREKVPAGFVIQDRVLIGALKRCH